MNVLDLTWALELNHFPSDIINKLKARFCANGDQQLKVVNYLEK